MKKFIIKTFCFLITIYALTRFFCEVYNKKNKIEKEILGKVNALKNHLEGRKCIVIAGDSRAERHLIPKVIE
jgi:hypothetical protein